jgi:Integrase zinc binding domain
MSKKLLNRSQARWSEFLSRLDFQITYRPGKAGGNPDALTRISGDLPQEVDESLNHQSLVVLKPQNVDPVLLVFHSSRFFGRPSVFPVPPSSSPHYAPPSSPDAPSTHPVSLEMIFAEGYAADPFPDHFISLLHEGAVPSKDISLAQCSVGLYDRLHYDGFLYVPDYDPLRLELIRRHHDASSAGHPGRAKTLELLYHRYYWPRMRKMVDKYLRNCHTCQRIRSPRHAPFGVLKPLPIPTRPWKSISMDFVTVCPLSIATTLYG